MPKFLKIKANGKRATSKFIYAKSNKKPGAGYKRYSRGLYRRTYSAPKWIKMMQNPKGKKSYAWRLKNRRGTRKQLMKNYGNLPTDLKKYISKFAGYKSKASARTMLNTWY